MIESCLNISNASFSYGDKTVISKVSQAIGKGVLYGILGPNGCGKTTLLDLIVGHKKLSAGLIDYMGKPIRKISKPELARHVALVSQNFYINFPYTVMDVVMMGRYPYIPRFAAPSETDFKVVEKVMEITEVARFQNHLVTELSGGERQRTVFARALAQDTDVLLLDEATSNLDISHTITLLDIVKRRVRKNGLTVISVFQDINLAAVYCDEMIFMKNGKIAASGQTDEMMDESLLEEVFHVQSEIRFEPGYQARQAIFKTGTH
ncbi:ABC transporter ATP-binding protein [Desulfococcaceae bacterium HSG8]|nr:ABC transporter ATP-binding protein [Desulfococcaceae bacterium HSG8]